MGMVPLKCPGCGANIELDDSREFGFCNYCGTKVVQDKLVVEHRGSVTIDSSNRLANLEKRLIDEMADINSNVDTVKKTCDELDIPYRETKVQVFSFMSVRCDPVNLTQLALKLNEYGKYTISAVTTEDISTINSWK